MQITLVAVMCHVLGAVVAEGVGTIPEAVCREVIVVKQDMPMQACMLSQPALAAWKASSICKSDDWRVARIKCVPGGDYYPRNECKAI
jgi:hypothetical protein